MIDENASRVAIALGVLKRGHYSKIVSLSRVILDVANKETRFGAEKLQKAKIAVDWEFSQIVQKSNKRKLMKVPSVKQLQGFGVKWHVK